MASELWVNDNGVGRKLTEVWVNDNGTPRKLKELWVNDSGASRCIFRGETVQLDDVSLVANGLSPANAGASYTLLNDGRVSAVTATNNQTFNSSWLTPNGPAAANYECFATVLSGTWSSGTFGQWLPLTTSRVWSKTQSAIGTSTVSMQVQIRRIGESTTLDTATVSFILEKEVSF